MQQQHHQGRPGALGCRLQPGTQWGGAEGKSATASSSLQGDPCTAAFNDQGASKQRRQHMHLYKCQLASRQMQALAVQLLSLHCCGQQRIVTRSLLHLHSQLKPLSQ